MSDRYNRVETYDRGVLGYLLSTSTGESEAFWQPLLAKERPNNYESVLEQCKRFYNATDPCGTLRTRFLQDGDRGRLHAVKGLSFQGMPRVIRHLLCSPRYLDIDLVNAHPVILSQYCARNNIQAPALAEYVTNRDAVIQSVIAANPDMALEKDHVKKAVISLINGGTAAYDAIPNKAYVLKDFPAEIRKITQAVIAKRPDYFDDLRGVLKAKGKLGRNVNGKLMALFLQSEEDRCLQAIEAELVEHGHPLGTLIPVHDGCMLLRERCPPDEEGLAALLSACEKRVRSSTGYWVKIIEKPMDKHVGWPGVDALPSDVKDFQCLDAFPLAKDLVVHRAPVFDPSDEFLDLQTRYRRTVFGSADSLYQDFVGCIDRYVKKINYPRCFLVNEGALGDNIMAPEAVVLKTRYMAKSEEEAKFPGGRLVEKTIDAMSFFNRPDVTGQLDFYSRLTFHPSGKCGKYELNRYTGLKASAVSSVDMPRIQPILDHIRNCWASSDESLYKYILGWLHAALAKPWEKTGVVLLLYGLPGTGKGILIDGFLIPFVYGPALATATQGLSSLTQRFNSVLMDKLFILANEVSSNESFHNTFETLKALITDETVTIERKGIDLFKSYPNYLNFIFTTNSANAVKMGKGDRRYACIEVSSVCKENFTYFEALHACFTQETANHFYTYLLDPSHACNVKRIPSTPLREAMLLNASSSVDMFAAAVREFITHPDSPATESFVSRIADFRPKNPNDEWQVPGKALFETYCAFCAATGVQRRVSHTRFGGDIARLFKRRVLDGRRIYCIADGSPADAPLPDSGRLLPTRAEKAAQDRVLELEHELESKTQSHEAELDALRQELDAAKACDAKVDYVKERKKAETLKRKLAALQVDLSKESRARKEAAARCEHAEKALARHKAWALELGKAIPKKQRCDEHPSSKKTPARVHRPVCKVQRGEKEEGRAGREGASGEGGLGGECPSPEKN